MSQDPWPSQPPDNNATYIPRPKRKRITPEQLETLVAAFAVSSTPSYDVRERLAQRLGLTNRECQVWFQNRRAKVARLNKEAAAVPAVAAEERQISSDADGPVASSSSYPSASTSDASLTSLALSTPSAETRSPSGSYRQAPPLYDGSTIGQRRQSDERYRYGPYYRPTSRSPQAEDSNSSTGAEVQQVEDGRRLVGESGRLRVQRAVSATEATDLQHMRYPGDPYMRPPTMSMPMPISSSGNDGRAWTAGGTSRSFGSTAGYSAPFQPPWLSRSAGGDLSFARSQSYSATRHSMTDLPPPILPTPATNYLRLDPSTPSAAPMLPLPTTLARQRRNSIDDPGNDAFFI